MAIKKKTDPAISFLGATRFGEFISTTIITTNGLALTKNTIHRNKLSYTTDGKRIIITDRSF
jgi:hypothetical protein